MEDFTNIVLFVLFIAVALFCIFMIICGIIDMCNNVKPKKKYYLIKCSFYGRFEFIIKAKSSVQARLKFHRKYHKYDFISIEEIKDE